jgi:hypothetical protein
VLARPEREADQMASSDAQVIEKARQIAREMGGGVALGRLGCA